ncbi:MAG: ATP-binding protein [Pseudobdellovibrionaceae bacterium]
MPDKKIIKRSITEPILKSKKSILLLGPRQTGKSTLLKSLKPDVIVNLANEREFLRYSSDIGYLETLITEQKPKTVLIDEIQRIPNLLNTLQDIIDNWDHPPKFYLSGSSARKLKRGQANLLPGRLFAYEIAGFTAKEMNYELNLKKALQYGFLPENYLSPDSEEIEKNLDMYSANYLAEEIKAEAATRNIQGFARFLHECATRSTQVLDYSKVATQAKVSRTSSLRFYEILEDTLIAQRIYSYEVDGVDSIKHPKLYFFDVGVLNGLLNNFSASTDRVGMLFENLVYNQIRNSALAADKKIDIKYFRTRHGLETDFVVQIGLKKIAIEVKAGQVAPKDCEAILALKSYDSSIDEMYVVGLKENKRRKIKNVIVCGVEEFIKSIGL